MRFNDDNINDILDKYKEEAREEFILKVYKLYFENATEEYRPYSAFDKDLLDEIFVNSTFSSLINEDLHYVLDKYPEYWAFHIIKEVNNTVDFDELRKMEIEKMSFKILEELSSSHIYILRAATINIGNYIEPKYVKRKKELVKNIGLKSITEQHTNKLAEKIIKYMSKEHPSKNKLPTNILAKEIAMYDTSTNEYGFILPVLEEGNMLNNIEYDLQVAFAKLPTSTRTVVTCQ